MSDKYPHVDICCWTCKSWVVNANSFHFCYSYCRKRKNSRDGNKYCEEWRPAKSEVELGIKIFEDKKRTENQK